MNASLNTTVRIATRPRTFLIRRASRPGLLLVLALALVPGVASAADVIQCVGTSAIEYSPGLTLTPTTTTIAGTLDLTTCTGVSDPPVASAFNETTAMLTTSCLSALGGPPTAQEMFVTWSTGDESTISYTSSINRVGTLVIAVVTGEITEGLFEGATVVGLTTYVAPTILNCLGPPGVTELSGPTLFTVSLAE